MPKARAIEFKRLLNTISRHPESIGCAVVAALIVLSFVQTAWAPYPRQPHEIMDRVDEVRSQLARTDWPESERARFRMVQHEGPANVVARLLYADISLSGHHHSQRLYKWLPGPGDFMLQEPDYIPVQHLIASYGRILIEQRPAHLASIDAPPQPGIELVDEIDWGDEFLSHDRANDPRTGTTMFPQVDGIIAPTEAFSTQTTPSREGRGYPYVAVRGLFDASSQIQAYSDAIHRGFLHAERLLELIDFELERQSLDEKQDEWSSWESVDIDVFRDVARSARGFEPDVVSSEATDTAITSPLLIRITGRWQTQATHPLLQQFDLSPQGVERESAFHRALIELQIERQQPPRDIGTPKGGFSNLLHDARALEEGLFDPAMTGMNASAAPRTGFGTRRQPTNPAVEELVRRMAVHLDLQSNDRDLRDWIQNRLSRTDNRQILFRYFDFDVAPGTTYRYRVRLELRNPNFGRSLASAGGDSEVVSGATRLTPWSEPTTPVAVAENIRYFLTRFEHPRQRQFPRARLNVFQYDTELGTVVQQELPVGFGQQIKGTVQARLLDPAAGVVRDADYTFQSPDTLLDALPDLTFDRSLHTDLQLPAGSTGLAHMPEYALFVTGDGELRAIDQLSQAEELARQQRYKDQLEVQLQHLRRDSETPDNWPDANQRSIYEDLFGRPDTMDDDQPQPRRPNSLQRRR